MDIGAEQLLDSMKGVTYLLDATGTIVAIGRRHWNAFARANGGADMADGRGVIGHSLFDFIAGDPVRNAWQAAFTAIAVGRRSCARVPIRCDSPGIRRDLLVLMSPVYVGGAVGRVLVQSLTLSEEQRPPMGLFDFPARRRQTLLDSSAPILAMCSYCQSVRYPVGSHDDDGEWISAEDYYRRGGVTNVRISHGLCPTCYDRSEAQLAA